MHEQQQMLETHYVIKKSVLTGIEQTKHMSHLENYGTYTPTLTGITNVTSTTSRKATWMKVGRTVTVAGQFEVTPTINNAQTKLAFSLPVASNFGTQYEACGVASTYGTGVTEHSGGFYADATNNRVELDYFETHGGVNTFSYQFTYEII